MPLLTEMRRRNIFKVSLAYAIVSWLIIQIADIILPTFNAPQWVMQVLVLVLILLFPVAALLSWAYELTPEGFKPTVDVDRTQNIRMQTGRKLNAVVIVLLSLAVIFLVVENYFLKPAMPRTPDFAYRQAIAVIPFDNRSAAEENAEFLADGLHDELLARLAKVTDLHVISRTSVMEYRNTTKNIRQIGLELGVGSILEGSVQRAHDDVRVNVQLIDARTDEHIWADTYDRELNAANLFAIQSDIATAIAAALEARLSPEEEDRLSAVPTENLAALEAYVAGKRLVERRDAPAMLASIERFERAVALDPRFARAWAGIAEAWLELPNYTADIDQQVVRRRASAAATRAIMLEPDSPEALAILGWNLLLHDYDWDGAEQALRAALQIEPSNVNALHWYSHVLSWSGKHDDAIAAAELAVQADPLSPLMAINLSYILMDARRWDASLAVAEPLLTAGSYPSLLGNLWLGSLRARQPQRATLQLLDWAAATGRDRQAAAELGELIVQAQEDGVAASLSAELVDRLQLVGSEIPEIFAALGDTEGTIAALSDANRTGAGFRSLLSLKINPSYDFIREDPRFEALLVEVGLAD